MPRYVIHVGLPKTGSTYLQYRFRAGRAALAARGILYPEVWENPRSFGHTVLANALLAGNPACLSTEFDRLNASAADIVLISAEDLCNLDKEGFARLRALVGDNQADIVYIFRRWSGLIPSVWGESVKQGNTATLPQFLLPHIMKPASSRLLNLDLRLAPIVEIFGRDHVHLVGYDHVRDQRIDLFDHFTRNFLGWAAPPAAEGHMMNRSLDPIDTELIRALNALHQQNGGTRNAELRVRLTAAWARMDFSAPRAAMTGNMAKITFRDNGPILRDLHEELATKYRDLVVEPRSNDRLFKPRVAEFAYATTDYLLTPGVVQALHEARNMLMSAKNPILYKPI